MWRALLMSIGFSLCILGGECMVVERMIMSDARASRVSQRLFSTSTQQLPADQIPLPGTGRKVFVPPEWAPWGLLSAGALVVLYSAALKPKDG